MGKLKKIAKKIVGLDNFLKIAVLYKKIMPKQITEKPVAFLFGFSNWKHSYMEAFLSDYEVVFIKDKENYYSILNKVEKYKEKVFIVWGYKDRPRLKKYAERKNIPYYRIEDGFIRSVQLGASKSTPISLCIDSKALYYDASQPSDLEDLLNNYDFSADKELINRAANCIQMLKELNISKYNNVASKNIESIYGKKEKKRILVIGQVEDDESIKRGCSKQLTNNDLVILAKMENPDAEIIYKPHPDVLFGKRPMQSNPNEVKHIAKVITEPLGLTDALQTIDHVYTITSLSGFEALLRGIPVTTLGAPFYSGWGLTDDRQTVSRRKRKLTIEEVFAAAYILYPKYLHPITKEPITIEEAIKIIKFMKDYEEQKAKANDHNDTFINSEFEIKNESSGKIGILSKGIQAIPNLQSFFKGEVVFNPSEHVEELSYIAGWGMKPSAQKALALSKKYNIPYLALEDGFLRSIGLGVDGAPPFSICFDDVGIYYDATRPSRLENILNNTGWESEKLLKDAEKAMELIRNHYLSKYNHAPMINPDIFKNNGKERVLVVDQTLGDMSISLGLADQNRFKEMYLKAKQDNPNADIYLKTHPDVISGKKVGNLTAKDVDDNAIFIYDDCNPLSLLEHVDKVYVVTSQLGFEALLLGKEVHCFGMPFYAGWGLTIDQLKLERRRRNRTLTEVFAAAYLIYPRYINPETGLPGTIFDVIEYLAAHRPNI
jgi:capsular polysaccharide export protein